jgi:transposase-like protein
MVLEALKCPYCYEVEQVKRYGTTKNGTQRYLCYASWKCFLKDYINRGHMPEVKTKMSQMAMNGIRDTARVLKVNRNTVMNHFKKSNRVLFVNCSTPRLPVPLKIEILV